VANLSGASARRRCSLPVGSSRRAGRGRWKKACITRPSASRLGLVGRVAVGSAPTAVPGRSKASRP